MSNLRPLGEIATFIRGITFKPDDVIDVNGPEAIACFRTKNVQEQIDVTDVWGVPRSFVKREEKLVREGDLLVSTANSWNLVGKCSWVPALPWPATLGGFISALRARRGVIDPRYLFWWFSSSTTQAAVRSCARQTTNIANLSLDRCGALMLPVPPLPEQQRIAAILDQADAVRRLRQRQASHLGELRAAIFRNMFREFDRSDALTTIGDIVRVSSGAALTAQQQRGGEYPVFGGNGINGWHDAYNVPAGTIVLGRVGVYCGAVHTTTSNAWVTDNALVVTKKIAVSTKYLADALHFSNLNQYAGRSAQPLISGSRVYPVKILVPDEAVQKEYDVRIDFVERQAARSVTAQAASDNLFNSLQHRAFRGEL